MASRGVVGAGLLALMLLTACGGRHDQAGGLPASPASGSAPPAASPAPSSPTLSATNSDPQAALRASAEQFVRDYFRLFNQVSHDHDFANVESLYLTTCVGCRRDVEYVKDEARRGLRAVGNDYQVLSMRVENVTPSGATIHIVTRAEHGELVNVAGKVVEGLRGWEQSPARVRLVRAGQQWKLSELVWGG